MGTEILTIHKDEQFFETKIQQQVTKVYLGGCCQNLWIFVTLVWCQLEIVIELLTAQQESKALSLSLSPSLSLSLSEREREIS